MDTQITFADLSQCADEKIHLPGSIQPHGVLLTLLEDSLSIAQASQSAFGAFGLGPEDLIGQPLSILIGESEQARIGKMLATQSLINLNPLRLVVNCTSGQKAFLACVYKSDGLLVFELESATQFEPLDSMAFLRSTNDAVTSILACNNTKELLQSAADFVRKLCAFDRVMIYLFDKDWNGTVEAESKIDNVASFLGFRFPASDIPAQARELYRRNTLRLSIDVNAPQSFIVPANNPLTGQPLDLSESMLRSMSPIHIEYLKNMNVAASMSISLTSGGELVGLVACHNERATQVEYRARQACDVLARLVSMRLDSLREREKFSRLSQLRGAREELLKDCHDHDDLPAAIASSDKLLDIVGAGGAAFVWDERYLLSGDTPDQHQVTELIKNISITMTGPIFASDQLSGQFPFARSFESSSSGMLALRLATSGSRWVLWFRPAVLSEISWAGNPAKPAITGSDMRIHPRKSFERWKQQITGQSAAWSDAEIQNALELQPGILDMELSSVERKLNLDLTHKVDELKRLNLEQESLSKQLTLARDAALDASQRKSEMVSVVNHDLRAPLTSIKGSLDILGSGMFALEPDAAELVKIAQNSANYLLDLIKSLLNLDNIESTNFKIDKTEVLLADLIKDAFQLVGATAQSASINLVSTAEPLTVFADKERILQVLVNLISNAIKFSPPQSQIVVSSSPTDKGCLVKVTDQGRGIPEDSRELIFQRFKQVETADRTEKGGIGLGLAICKAIVEAHGGSIGVESSVGKGSTFWFILPSPSQPGTNQ
jgi:light-regulated signal transduction histidine kinase (bacteriophytochrome)